MDKIWNITIDFLAKVNTFIPLVAVLWAGLGLIGIVLILAITGCVLRKRLVPNWLMWTYFIFASIIIFAQANNDIFTVVENIEIPFLVVLVCYVLRSVFYRRPRYTFSTRSITVREIDKSRPVKNAVVEENPSSALEVEKVDLEPAKENEDLILQTEEVAEEKVEDTLDEVEAEAEKEESSESEEVAAEVATEEKEAVEETVTEAAKEEVVESEEKVEMPEVKPIAEPVMPNIQPAPAPAPAPTPVRPTVRPATTGYATSSITSSFARPSATTSSFAASRPTTTTTTTSTTSTTSRPLGSYSSLYGSRLGNTTTTTRPTPTTTTSSATSSLNRPAGLGTANAKTPRSTDDIMAAIERLRASMKK